MSQLIERLKKHDYFYEYSDDTGVHISGMGEEGRLITALAELPLAEAARLVALYVPESLRPDWLKRISQRAAKAGAL